MKLSDIPKIIDTKYNVDCTWEDIYETWTTMHRGMKVNLQPDFQRGYVWTEAQQVSYLENMIRCYPHGRDVYFNHPTWGSFENSDRYELVCLDGQQRIGAIAAFMENRIQIFGNYYRDFEDRRAGLCDGAWLKVHVSRIQSRSELIKAYISLNFAGTAHEAEEKAKLLKLLDTIPEHVDSLLEA